jgi:hypothetical protein
MYLASPGRHGRFSGELRRFGSPAEVGAVFGAEILRQLKHGFVIGRRRNPSSAFIAFEVQMTSAGSTELLYRTTYL